MSRASPNTSLKNLARRYALPAAGCIFSTILQLMELPFGKRGIGQLRGAVLDELARRQRRVQHNGIRMRFASPNSIAEYRIRTFSTKEPDTLRWIENFDPGSIFWDVGANVGLYTVFAAQKHRDIRVIAWEPSAFNLAVLARNIAMSDAAGRIEMIPLPLSNQTGIAPLTLTDTRPASALSAFGVNHDDTGAVLQEDRIKAQYRTLGLSVDDAVEKLGLPPPNYLKIDVDGIEHLILKGASRTLAHPGLKSVLVEISATFDAQRDEIAAILLAAGYRQQAPDGPKPDGRAYNTIWFKYPDRR